MAARARLARRAAAASAGLLLLTWLLAVHVGAVERADAAIFAGFYDLQHHPYVTRVANLVAGLCDPFPYVLLAAGPLFVALVRRRPRILLAIAVVLVGANVSTEILKPLLAAQRPSGTLAASVVGRGSWPSGHATAAMSLAFCCVLAVPARLRPAVATAGAAFAVAVSYSFLALGWHYPSDVLGGYLVATTWTMAAVAWVLTVEVRHPRRIADDAAGQPSVAASLVPQAAVLTGAAGLACLLALARPHAVLVYARDHLLFIAGAAGIGVLALSLAGFITLSVRR